jgi:glycine oxidase
METSRRPGSAAALIVGGGLVGALIGLRLAESGFAVRVLDRGAPGGGASSAAAGILAAQSEATAPGAALDLGLEGRALHADLDAELRALLGRGSSYARIGALEPTTDERRADTVGRHLWQRSAGLRLEPVDAAALRDLAPGLHPRFTGGVLFPDDAAVDPPALVGAVVAAAERRGVAFVAGVDVRGVVTHGDRVTGVRTAHGTLDADVVVLCGGAWSALLEGAGDALGAIAPARGQLLELAAAGTPIGPVIYAGGGYLVPRADGRVCVGSTLEMVGFATGNTAAGVRALLDRAVETVPALGAAGFNRAWSSFRPRTPDGLPLVGALGSAGLYVAAGHHRSGVLLAPVTAAIVRDLVVDGRRHRHLDALSPHRFGSTPT